MKTMKARWRNGLGTRTFQALFILGLYYMWYRYPFQISSSSTSPTYSDTPSWIQEGKYILLIAVLLAVAIVMAATWARPGTRPSLHNHRFALLAGGLLLAMSAFAVIKGLIIGDTDSLKLGVILGVGIVLCALSLGWTLDGDRLVKILSVFAIVVILVDALQIALYATTGRLPALAYARSVSIRFGSILDDPNGLAFLMPLLLGAVLLTWKSVLWRVVVACSLVIALVLTQSLTGVASCLLAAVIGTFTFRGKNPRRFWIVLLASISFVAALLTWLLLSGIGRKFVEAKAGSFFSHLTILDDWKKFDILTLLGFNSKILGSESSYISLVLQFGLPFTLAYCFLGIAAVVLLAKVIRAHTSDRPPAIYVVFFYFLIAFLIGSVNLRLSDVYPLNLFYVMGVAVSVFAVVERRRAEKIDAHLD